MIAVGLLAAIAVGAVVVAAVIVAARILAVAAATGDSQRCARG